MIRGSFQTINPATEETLAVYSHFDGREIERLLEEAHQSYRRNRSKTVTVRATELRSLAFEFRKEADETANLISLEMGKPISDSRAEVEKCAFAFEYYADHLAEFLEPEEVASAYRRSLVVKDPIGPLLAIMPWNFPVWQIVRCAAPAVGIGNPILLKHSDLTAGTAKKIEEIFARVAPGLLYNLCMDHEQAARVTADQRVAAVTLTGSSRAGREVAQEAGRFLKKTVLELGGSDAYVVFQDSDVESAAMICARARMINNGQSCIAAKRFIVHRSVMDRFIDGFEKTIKDLKRGSPLDSKTQVGSLAAKRFQVQLLDQCSRLEQAGAVRAFDIALKEDFDFSARGAFFPARAYRVDSTNPVAFHEEFFGPVALLFSFETEAEALELCNRSAFGLGGAVFSSDLDRALDFSRLMEAGFIAVNDSVRSDPRLPFGGVKESGYGRELGLYGFHEFCNIKTLGFG